MNKKNNALIDVIRGMVIGIANIIPGVSGGTMMVSMGIYDQLIYSITHLFSDWKKVWRFLLPIGIGIVLAILLLSKLFEFLLGAYPIPTNLGFCGLILGSLPFIFQNVKHKGFGLKDFIPFIVFFLLIIGFSLLEEKSGADVLLKLDLPGILMLFVVGVITAATMVIPGVSGSMLLMLMGYYEPILSTISNAIDALIHFDIAQLMYIAGLMVPFALGVAVGTFGIAKIIEWIFSRWKTQAYWAIIGLIIASPIAILVKTDWAGFSIIQLVIGILCFGAGALAAYRLSEL
ncbi:DUF368 domain-containing protein [Ileibacterium valens]|uniref:DUF368 domain-containing protein n=1 Tax=Ileibacterium valens TaxID=1862668 RepID=UPI002729DA0F|nr:DUF368 domain-containing protein [Ileibacterium valens]